jgi:hypothetical protein
MRTFTLVLTLFAITACTSVTPSTAQQSAKGLVDVSTSIDPVRTEFNAHKSEARFLTLLSPS